MFTCYSYNNEVYNDYLFNNLPFIFIGNYNQLVKMSDNILSKNNKKIVNENLIFWKNYKNENYKADLELVINNKEYADKKGLVFSNIYEYYKKYNLNKKYFN